VTKWPSREELWAQQPALRQAYEAYWRTVRGAAPATLDYLTLSDLDLELRIGEVFARRAEHWNVWDACPMCAGMGAFTLDVPVTHRVFGRAFPCPCKVSDRLARRLQQLTAEYALPQSHLSYTFDNWHAKYAALDRRAQTAYDAAIAYVGAGGVLQTDERDYSGLAFWGSFASGKTSLMFAVCHELMRRGEVVLWIDFNRLMAKVQATYASSYDGPSKEVILRTLRDAPYLALDDVGDVERDRVSDDRRDILYDIVSARDGNRSKHLLLTTNLAPARFEAYFGGRIAARVGRACYWLEMQQKMVTHRKEGEE
jgi:DNA replication protein DnaC